MMQKHSLWLYGWLFLALMAACNTQTKPAEKFQTLSAEEGGYTYEYVVGDPLGARIYTLPNGLKVYLSAYKEAPRIQALIPVKAGGKNDPAHATGLAHYLEHMLFKGTSEFGTMDWEKEKPLLDSIERMFEHYRTLTDPAERKSWYQKIDQVSNQAASYAIANEYDRMVSKLGAKGLNAYTTEDRTVYMCDIPANELERFLQIESLRFGQIVNRLFHTELEAVYEEKNRSLDNDYWKMYEALYESIFPGHPYGTQTVIGTIEHLKNPSITEINRYFEKYYVPNNVAICLSGDLDYTATIRLIDKYFSGWQSKPVEEWKKPEATPLSAPVEREVLGPDREMLMMAFRMPARSHPDHVLAQLTDMLLVNSQAGLIDLNLVQQQKVLEASCFLDNLNDYALHTFSGEPREGQTLAQVRDLLLGQIELIKKGEFEDWLLQAVVNDLKKGQLKGYGNNYTRADAMVMAFTQQIPWAEYTAHLDRMSSITKEQVVAFANQYYQNNYAVVYKRTGQDPNRQLVEKPTITKVTLNREAISPFQAKLMAQEPPRLQPIFVNYQQDIQEASLANGVKIYYHPNRENELFNLYLRLDMGSNHDPRMGMAVNYLQYLGTSAHSAEELQKEFYKLGCSFSVNAGNEQLYVSLEGLSQNMVPALQLLESLLTDAQPDPQALADMVAGVLKEREEIMKDKYAILSEGLFSYAKHGKRSPFTNVLSNAELNSLTPEELVERIKGLINTEHRVLYYGPMPLAELTSTLGQHHKAPAQLQPLPPAPSFPELETNTPQVFWTHYDMVQAELMFMHKGPAFQAELAPAARLFNEYFGNLTYQEIREAQGLAYSVWANYTNPNSREKAHYMMAYVGTQADKQAEAMKALSGMLLQMPESEAEFQTAKEAIMSKIESERITKSAVLFNYENARRLGLSADQRKQIYEQVRNMTLADLKAFHEQQVKNGQYSVVLIGDRAKLNFRDLSRYGKVTELSLKEIFGYEVPEKVQMQ